MNASRALHVAPEAELLKLIFGKNVSMALAIVAKLRIADRLGEGPRGVDDLAAETGTHSPSLRRVLRTLASVGVFSERTDGVFALTPMGAYLRTGVKGSLRGLADALGSDWCWRSWGHAPKAVRTGRAAFDAVFGEPVFDYLGKHPEDSAVFSEAMDGFTSNVAPAVASGYDFSAFGTVVDVGGGHGVLLAAILRAYPSVRGIVYDAPHVATGAESTIRKEGLQGRCRALGGDFFEGVPEGGDAYLLKHIIHDWSDDEAATILRHCRAGVNPGGKLLLVEMVIAPGDSEDVAKLIDLELLVNLSGRERTEAEFRQLVAKAGWRLTRVIPTESPTRILEAEPA